jgi:hypothetical protein
MYSVLSRFAVRRSCLDRDSTADGGVTTGVACVRVGIARNGTCEHGVSVMWLRSIGAWHRFFRVLATESPAFLLAVLAFAVAVAVGLPLAWNMLGSSPGSLSLALRRVAAGRSARAADSIRLCRRDPARTHCSPRAWGDGTLAKIDTRTNRVMATASGLPSVTGVIVVPALGRVYASWPAPGRSSPSKRRRCVC